MRTAAQKLAAQRDGAHHDESVRVNAPGPEVRAVGPDGSVVVERHGKMIADEVLSTYPEIHGVPAGARSGRVR